MQRDETQTTRKKCTHCGNEIPNSNTDYCLNCGTDKYILEVKITKNESKPTKIPYVAFAIVLIALCFSIIAVITAIPFIAHFVLALFSIITSITFALIGAILNTQSIEKDKIRATFRKCNYILVLISFIIIIIAGLLLIIFGQF